MASYASEPLQFYSLAHLRHQLKQEQTLSSLQVTEDQRYTLIEYISHLMNSDYPRVADDLVRLGFVPEDRADPEKTAAAVPQLTRVMTQLIQGGGVRNINVQQVRGCRRQKIFFKALLLLHELSDELSSQILYADPLHTC